MKIEFSTIPFLEALWMEILGQIPSSAQAIHVCTRYAWNRLHSHDKSINFLPMKHDANRRDRILIPKRLSKGKRLMNECLHGKLCVHVVCCVLSWIKILERQKIDDCLMKVEEGKFHRQIKVLGPLFFFPRKKKPSMINHNFIRLEENYEIRITLAKTNEKKEI